MTGPRTPLGRRFLTVWAGQALSAIGSSVSGIGIAVAVFVETGDAATLGWFVAIASMPFVLTAPLIPLVDRFPKRAVMIVGDTIAAIGPTVALAIALTGDLEVWHLAAAAFLGGIGTSIQVPAAAAAVPALVVRSVLDRANGLAQAGPAAGIVVGPVIATPLVARWGVEAVLIVDVVTFLIAVGTTLAVRFDDQAGGDAADADDGSWGAVRRWLVTGGRPLLTLFAAMAVTSFLLPFFNVSILVVATEVGGVTRAGLVLGAGGAAMLAASMVTGRRGVSADRLGVVAGGLAAVGAGFIVAAARPQLVVVMLGVAISLAAVPYVSAAGSTIFHEQVPPLMHARVFGLRTLLSRALDPVGAVVGGVIVADVAEPAMSADGALADSLGWAFGTGPGRGAAVVIAVAGLALLVVAVVLRRAPARELLVGDVGESTGEHPDEPAPETVELSRR